jgi:hypothetical protein
LPNATWDAWFDTPGGKLECEMRLWCIEGDTQVEFVNGSEIVEFDHCSWDPDTLVFEIPMPDCDARIVSVAATDTNRLDGEWIRGASSAPARLAFHASYRGYVRSTWCGMPAWPAGSSAARWRTSIDAQGGPPALLTRTSPDGSHDAALVGGDRVRHLQPRLDYDTNRMTLTRFDGASAILLQGRIIDGALEGTCWSSDAGSSTWSAQPDGAAELADARARTTRP